MTTMFVQSCQFKLSEVILDIRVVITLCLQNVFFLFLGNAIPRFERKIGVAAFKQKICI